MTTAFTIARAASLLACIFSLHGYAQDYPVRAVRIIVPFAPGGGTDIIARAHAPHLGRILGQQFIIDNRPGGGTLIGAELAARSPADGYTLFMGITGTMAINPAIFPKLPYDPVKDFSPIALVAVGPNVLVVHPSLPVRNIRELIATAKAHPGKLLYASSGTGGAPHLAGELFKSMAGVQMIHVPYKGAAPATMDLLAGHVQVMFAGMGAALPHMKAGKLRALGVAGERRSAATPDLPTIGEYLKGYEASTWFGVFSPAGTPRPIVTRLNAVLNDLARDASVTQHLINQGYEPLQSTPEALGQYVKSELAKWGKLIREAKITEVN